MAHGVSRRARSPLAEARVREVEKPSGEAAVLAKLAAVVASADEEQRVLAALVDSLEQLVPVQRAAVFLAYEGRATLDLRFAAGVPPPEQALSLRHALVSWLHLRGAVAECLRGAGNRMPVSQAALEAAARLGWNRCLPLWHGGELVGVLGWDDGGEVGPLLPADAALLVLVSLVAGALRGRGLSTELARAREVVARSGRLAAIGSVAAGIAHEIRNPLASIRTFFALAPERLDDEEFRGGFLRMTADEVERVCDLTGELLGIARAGHREPEVVDLVDVVSGTVALVAAQSRQRGVSIRFEVGEVDATLVRADPGQLRQVLLNLLLNAVEVSPAGETVCVTVRADPCGSAEQVEIEVADRGPGVAVEMREDIFSPFFTTKKDGTGLGLSIARQIVLDHGGSIRVDGAPGEGSRFCVLWPSAD